MKLLFGLDFGEIYRRGMEKRIRASYCVVSPYEQQLRVKAVIELSAELVRVREKTNFATRRAEAVIGAIIEGDWKSAEEWVEHFRFTGEHPQIREAAAGYWEDFAFILEAMCLEARNSVPGPRRQVTGS